VRTRPSRPRRHAVDQQADQGLELGVLAVRGRRADDEVVLAAVAVERRRPAGEEGHEEGGPLTAAERPQCGYRTSIERERPGRAAVALHRRPRPVGGKREDRRRSREPAAPVGEQALERLARQAPALPGGIVGILQRQRGEAGLCRVPARGIERRQLVEKDAERPAVADDVVQGDEEHVLARRQPRQRRADQGSGGEVERPQRLCRCQQVQLGVAGTGGEPSEIDER
jgi:hypothetical protein